jgi:hypothetical protein
MQNDSITPTVMISLAARDRLGTLAAAPANDERAASRFAKEALFAEAMLHATRARLAELRTVAK